MIYLGVQLHQNGLIFDNLLLNCWFGCLEGSGTGEVFRYFIFTIGRNMIAQEIHVLCCGIFTKNPT